MLSQLISFIVLIAIFLLQPDLSHAQSLPPQKNSKCLISLHGLHRFSAGDNMEWTMPAYDDTAWKMIKIPGTWQSQGISPDNAIGWHRICFFAPDCLREIHPAVMLGRIGNADEVFLNGVKIGGEGSIGDAFVEIEWKFRLYPFPKGIVRFGQDNLLAVRVMNTYRGGGIMQGPACIGEYGDLLDIKYQQEFDRKSVEITLFSFLLPAFFSVIFLHTAGVRDKEYLAFGIFIFLYIIVFVLDSVIFYETGMKTPFVQRVVNALYAVIPGFAFVFILLMCQKTVSAAMKILLCFFGVLSAAMLIPFPCRMLNLLLSVWAAGLVTAIAVSLYVSVRAWLQKLYESGPVLIGILGLTAGGATEMTDMIHPVYFQNADLMGTGMAIFLCSMLYALMARHSRIQKSLHLLSGRILEAHEEERKRLSREIHDGLGQSLLAVKLYLQMMQRESDAGKLVEKDIFPGLIAEISGAISELREMATDLRPVTLEKLRLTELLRWYARKFSEKTGICVYVQGDDELDVPLKIKDHLYRICQEAFSNISKHANADCVQVQAEKRGKMLCLCISDNGDGFDLSEHIGKTEGIGLSTIKERTELLGGMFHIKSRKGKGTVVQIEIPTA
jgi:signal transduction histidine kinase